MKKIILILCVMLCVTACRKVDLYHGLSEEEANEMLVVLQQEGISAAKVKEIKQNEVFWTVEIDPRRMNDARRLLHEHSLPRKKAPGLEEVYKEKGLIPTPDEQKARYLLALKGEIINSFLKMSDVINADVVLNIPTADEFAQPGAKEKRPTASILLKVKPSETGVESLSEAKIQQFVANSVENLNPRDVSVIITYITPKRQNLMPGQSAVLPNAEDIKGAAKEQPLTRIAGVEVSESSQGRLKMYLAIFFILLAILAAALIFNVISSSRMREELKAYEKSPKSLVEGKIVDEKHRIGGSGGGSEL